jgi:opacity protein-like surface antigen
VVVSVLPSPVAAEWYAGGFAGDGFPGDFRNIVGTGAAHGVRQTDTALHETLLIGGKLAHYSDRLPWLGVEAELHHSNPHIRQNPNPQPPLLPLHTSGSSVSMWIGTLNTVIRYPGPRVQPYVGFGLAVAHANIKDATINTTATQAGVNAMLGLRVFVTDQIGLFGEFKYIAVPTMIFDNSGGPNIGAKADFAMPAVAVGVTWHLGRQSQAR